MTAKCLHFKVEIDRQESLNVFENLLKSSEMPPPLKITEYDMLSAIRMSRHRNRELYNKLIAWYGAIPQKLRVI